MRLMGSIAAGQFCGAPVPHCPEHGKEPEVRLLGVGVRFEDPQEQEQLEFFP